MKKRFVACVTACAMFAFCCLSGYASPIDSAVVDDNTGILAVSGTLDLSNNTVPNGSSQVGGIFNETSPIVTIIVLNPGKTRADLDGENRNSAINSISITTADPNSGAYSYNGRIIGESGTYTVIVGNRYDDSNSEAQVVYENRILNGFNTIKNSGTAEQLKTFIEEEYAQFNIDLYGYNKLPYASKMNVLNAIKATVIADNSNNFHTVAEVSDAFSSEVAKEMFISVTDTAALSEFVIRYFKTQPTTSKIATFLDEKASSNVKNAVIAKFIPYTYTNITDFSQKLSDETLLEYVKSCGIADSINDCLDSTIFAFPQATIDKYNALTNKQAVVNTVWTNASEATSGATIVALFNSAVTNQALLEASTIVTDPSPSYGGGGGGGVANVPSKNVSVSVTDPTKVPTNNNTNNDSEVTTPVTEKSFNDISNVAWANEAIIKLSKNGVINGTSETTFEPNAPITREQFIHMLMNGFKYSGVGSTATFTDVSEDSWYYKSVAAAVTKGIVKGYANGSFGVGESISREDMAVMLTRTADAAGIKLSEVNGILFEDYDTIDSYAKTSVDSLSSAGILTGNEAKCFEPHSTLTRAEGAKALYEFLKYCGLSD